MKIVLISPAHPLRGGIAASSERLALAFQEAGHEVVIYSFAFQYPGFLFPGKTQYADGPAPEGLHIKTLLHSLNPFNWWRTGRALAREKPDRIVVRFWLPLMGPCLGSVLRVARWGLPQNVRVTSLVDNIVPHEKRPGDRLFARYFVRACDDFVVMSRSVGEEIKTFLPNTTIPSPTLARLTQWFQNPKTKIQAQSIQSVFQIRNPKSEIRFAPHPIYDIYGPLQPKAEARQQLSLPADAPTVLFFGFIRAYKGLDLLLEALADTPGVHALVAGECYEPWEPYQVLIERLGLAERVHLHTDYIPNEAVGAFFGAADLVVQPYKTATQSGISQIAFHYEKPMVVTSVGGLPEIVADGVSGYVVPPKAQAIAEAIRDYFKNRREGALSEGVKREKMRFSWENLVKTLLPG